MNEIKNTKNSNLSTVAERLGKFTREELAQKHEIIERRLFEFANFIESQIVFLYTPVNSEFSTEKIIKRALQIEKQLALPLLSTTKNVINLYKITNYNKDLVTGVDDILEPNIKKCKKIPLEDIDIAIIPGLAFDDKGGRVGFGNDYYRRLISKLPETCRKISLAYEEQVVDQIQMESRKYTVDIIITDKRIIYKI
ncbi:MAG: 5-formyltetrahydrofolate cyclo-ligase [Thermodesulfobacteriota bacterium]